VAHFPQLRTPALFVHGTADPFGSVAELRGALTLIPAPTTLHLESGVGHDLGAARRSHAALAALAARVAERWVELQA
jgi:predicted alpha/beta-hydrolase family hydrolase